MSKLVRNTSSEEHRAFWASVKKMAETVRSGPDWMRAGIELNAQHYVTCGPRSTEDGLPPPEPVNERVG